jgi:hypothetical protein
MYKIAIFAPILWLFAVSANAACIVGGGLAGQDTAYRYAVAHINGLMNADDAFSRMDKISSILKKPDALASVSESLTNFELAAKSFECAAKVIGSQKNFTTVRSNEYAQGQIELARQSATVTEEIYLDLAKEIRGIASLFVEYMKHTISDVDLASKMAQSSAKIQDSSSNLPTLILAITHVLVDPVPDSSNHMSRLQITRRERDDILELIRTGFGKRAWGSTDRELPATDASVTMLRNWLTTSGHSVRK